MATLLIINVLLCYLLKAISMFLAFVPDITLKVGGHIISDKSSVTNFMPRHILRPGKP